MNDDSSDKLQNENEFQTETLSNSQFDDMTAITDDLGIKNSTDYTDGNNDLHHVFTSQTNNDSEIDPLNEVISSTQVQEKTPRNPKKLVAFILTLLVFFIVLSIPMGLVGAAYGKIPVSKEFRLKAQKLLFAIPFIPKTKEFVLMNSFSVHKNVASAYFDASLAGKVSGFDPTLQTFLNPALLDGQSDTFEMSMKGFVDAKDINNQISQININMANQLEGDMLRSKDSFYFKISKVPTILSTYLSMINGSAPSVDPLLNKWVFVDTKKLNTDANDIINNKKNDKVISAEEKKYAYLVDKFINDRVMSEIKMESDVLDGSDVFKFHLDLTGELLDDFAGEMKKADDEIKVLGYSTSTSPVVATDKPSEYFHDVSVDFWIDKESYYLRRADLFMVIKDETKDSGEIINYNFGSGDETIEVAMSVTLSQIGETFTFEAPNEFVTIEEYGAEVGRIILGKPVTID